MRLLILLDLISRSRQTHTVACIRLQWLGSQCGILLFVCCSTCHLCLTCTSLYLAVFSPVNIPFVAPCCFLLALCHIFGYDARRITAYDQIFESEFSLALAWLILSVQQEVYDTKSEMFVVRPWEYNLEQRQVEQFLQMCALDDESMLHCCSTSPLVEGPGFVQHMRSCLRQLTLNPSGETLFPHGELQFCWQGGGWEPHNSAAKKFTVSHKSGGVGGGQI